MIPYADFVYFGILLYIALPTLLIRRLFGFSRAWILLVTAAMLILQYGTIAHLLPVAAPEGSLVSGGFPVFSRLAEVRDIWVVLACGLFQWTVAWAFLRMKTRTPWYWPFPVALAMALLRFPRLREIDQPDLIMFGFHGTSVDSARKILDEQRMIPSTKEYDWLGHGIYFWEDDPVRALEWAKGRFADAKVSVIQARIRRGICLNELNAAHRELVREAERLLVDRLLCHDRPGD